MSDKKPEQKQVEVVLVKPHTHAGIDYPAGQKIKVSEPERVWLAEQKIINDAPKAQEGAK